LAIVDEGIVLGPRKWTLGKAADYLVEQGYDVPVSTLRGWFNELHRIKIHTLDRNERKDRVLNETDIQIAKYIHDAKNEFGGQISLKTIGQELVKKFNVYYDQQAQEEDSFQLQIFDEDKIKEFLKEQLQSKAIELEELIEKKYQNRLALLPSPAEELVKMRSTYLDIRIIEIQAKKELKKEALDLWSKNPVKVGFIIKKESTSKKEEFIENYIDERIEQKIVELVGSKEKGES
jgi:hypothetical protein